MKTYFASILMTLGILTAGIPFASASESTINMGQIVKAEQKSDSTEVFIRVELPVCHATLLEDLSVNVHYEDESAYINVAGRVEYENKDIQCFHDGSKSFNVKLDRRVDPRKIYLGFEK